MLITERQEQILNKIIQEYIFSAQPVSSRLLEKKYDFGICPATIRAEMQKLTDRGFLHQPHASAGRLPTDKGYRFLVDDLIKEGIFEKDFDSNCAMEEIENLIEEELKDTVRFVQSLTKNLAIFSSNLVVSYLPDEKILWKEGWEKILAEPEFREGQLILNFSQFLKNFEEEIGKLKINSGVKIYIGKETPFPKAKDFSIICARCHFPRQDYNSSTVSSHSDKSKWVPGIVSLLGPKRMAYDKNISLVNSLVKALEELQYV